MSKFDFSTALKHLPKINMVTLHGIGEPTLNPNFIDILEISKSSKKFGKIKITSNGLAKPPSFYVDAMNAGLNEVWISVDSLNQSLATELRENSNVDKLLKNISELGKLSVPTYISMTVSSKNFRECMATSHLLIEHGVKAIYMQEFQDFGNSDGVMSNHERYELLERFIEHKKRYPKDNISPPRFVFNAIQKSKSNKIKHNDDTMICTAPWSRPAMNVDGFMTPCCTTFDPAIWNHSSLLETHWSDIYRSDHVTRWIQEYLQNSGNQICEGCAINPKYDNVDLSVGVRKHQAPARI